LCRFWPFKTSSPAHVLAACAIGVTLVLGSAPAWADATAFVGISTSPESRRTIGFAVGSGLLVVGFEFEYAHTREDIETMAPSVRTFMGNLMAQTPIPIHGVIFYGTVGGGFYRERFETTNRSETNAGTNLGGGVKIALAGPLRLRVDYRVFMLRGTPVYERPQRFYVGLNLAF
jgi:hypothetical protein